MRASRAKANVILANTRIVSHTAVDLLEFVPEFASDLVALKVLIID